MYEEVGLVPYEIGCQCHVCKNPCSPVTGCNACGSREIESTIHKDCSRCNGSGVSKSTGGVCVLCEGRGFFYALVKNRV